MNDPFEIPWGPEEMENYRRGGPGKTWKYHWRGWGPKEIADLWAVWGGRGNEHLIECPDCGRPESRDTAERHQMGRCWNCWKENAYPGDQEKAIAKLNGKSIEERPVPALKRLKGDL